MAIFNITSTPASSLNINKLSELSTNCATIYKYRVIAETGNEVSITLTGNAESAYYYTTNEMDKTTFTGGVTLSYTVPFTVVFIISNSGVPGIFGSALLTIKNITTDKEIQFYETRQNDNARCDSSESIFVKKSDYNKVTVEAEEEQVISFDPTGKSVYQLISNLSASTYSIEGFSLSMTGSPVDAPYLGKIFSIINNTDKEVLLKHDEDVSIKMYLPNNEDFIIPLKGVVYLRYDSNGLTYVWQSWTDNKNTILRRGYSSPYSIAQAVDSINNNPPFEIKTDTNFVFIMSPANISEGFNSYVYILKEKGIGLYGDGANTITASDLQLISIIGTSSEMIAELPTTQFINLGEIGSTAIHTAFNAHTFTGDEDPVQEQNEGYVLVRSLREAEVVEYLFIGTGGDYGTGGTETATADDFVLLDENETTTPDNNIVTTVNVLNTDLATENEAGLTTYFNTLNPAVYKTPYESWIVNIVDNMNNILSSYILVNRGKGFIGISSTVVYPILTESNFFKLAPANPAPTTEIVTEIFTYDGSNAQFTLTNPAIRLINPIGINQTPIFQDNYIIDSSTEITIGEGWLYDSGDKVYITYEKLL